MVSSAEASNLQDFQAAASRVKLLDLSGSLYEEMFLRMLGGALPSADV